MLYVGEYWIHCYDSDEVLGGNVDSICILEDFIRRTPDNVDFISFYIFDDQNTEVCHKFRLYNNFTHYKMDFASTNLQDNIRDWNLVKKVIDFGNMDDRLLRHIVLPEEFY